MGKYAVIIATWVAIIWFFVANREPTASTAPPPGPPSAPVNPPPPAVVVQDVELIKQIAAAGKDDGPTLWELCQTDDDLHALLLGPWIIADEEAALAAVKDTELEEFAFQLLGAKHGPALWEEALQFDYNLRQRAIEGIIEHDIDFVLEKILSGELRLDIWTMSPMIHACLAEADQVLAQQFLEDYPQFLPSIPAAWIKDTLDEVIALISVNRHHENLPLDQLAERMFEIDPKAASQVLAQLPTGKLRADFETGLKRARAGKNSCDISARTIKPNRDPAAFLAVVEEALAAPPSEWASWFKNESLLKFDTAQRNLVHSFIRKRWLHHDPIAFLKSRQTDERSTILAFSHWLALDQEAPLAYLDSLIETDRWRAERAFRALHEAIGMRNSEEAFRLCHRFPKLAKDAPLPPFEGSNDHLTEDSRDRYLAAATVGADPARLEAARMKVIWAWLERDFFWTIARVQEWNVDGAFLPEYPYWLKSPLFLDNFHQFSEEWRAKLVHYDIILAGAHPSWLLQPPPSHIDADSLRTIRDKREWAWMIPSEELNLAQELIDAEGLIGQRLASDLLWRLMNHRTVTLAQAEMRLKRVPERFREIAERHYEKRVLDDVLAEERRLAKRPAFLCEILGDSEIPLPEEPSGQWKPSHFQQIRQKLESLEQPEATELITNSDYQVLPIQLQALVLKRALPIYEGHSVYPFTYAAERIATNWGRFDPAEAAKWGDALEPGAVRERAISAIYREWSRRNQAEAQQWGKTLSAKERKRLHLE